jgi:cytochrome c-type biogenesis protein CcmH
VRIEVSRRLLEADRRAGEVDQATVESRNSTVFALIAALIAGGSLGLYSWIGAPGYGDLPMSARLAASEEARATRPDQATAEAEAAPMMPKPTEVEPRFTELMERLRAAVDERPDDIQGLTLLAQNEVRLGNMSAARAAQERIIVSKGADASIDDRSGLLDLMVLAAGGYVSPEAETLSRELLSDDPEQGIALYYMGLLELQTGRADRTFAIWRRLLENSPPNAPWVPVIREQIDGVAAAAGVDYELPAPRGPNAGDIAAAADMSAQERDEMIRGMVEGLAERLASDGGPVEDWARLITALGVLGETDQARQIATEAESVFADENGAMELIAQARARAGIAE